MSFQKISATGNYKRSPGRWPSLRFLNDWLIHLIWKSKWERDKEGFHLLLHFRNAYNSQSWSTSKPTAVSLSTGTITCRSAGDTLVGNWTWELRQFLNWGTQTKNTDVPGRSFTANSRPTHSPSILTPWLVNNLTPVVLVFHECLVHCFLLTAVWKRMSWKSAPKFQLHRLLWDIW